MAKFLDKTMDEWDDIVDKWNEDKDTKLTLPEYMDLNEIEFLRLAIVSGKITGGTIAKDWYDESEFTNKRFWSSSEASSLCAWNWCHHRQRWETIDKSNCISVFFTRSF